MIKPAMQIAVLVLNVYLIVMFSGRTEVIAAWQRYICLVIGAANIIAVAKDSLLMWLVPYWPLLEEIFEWLSQAPILMMILNGLSLLIFGLMVAGRLFGGGEAAPGFGPYLLAAAAPVLSLYYAYTLYDEEG